MGFISSLLAKLAGSAANVGSSACLMFMLDESECPKSLVK